MGKKRFYMCLCTLKIKTPQKHANLKYVIMLMTFWIRSDEIGCKCGDLLKKENPSLVNNGVKDCQVSSYTSFPCIKFFI